MWPKSTTGGRSRLWGRLSRHTEARVFMWHRAGRPWRPVGRRRPSYANVAATLALVLVVGGGTAYAAHQYLLSSLSQIKPSVRKELRGARGARGKRGPAGVAGIHGAAPPAESVQRGPRAPPARGEPPELLARPVPPVTLRPAFSAVGSPRFQSPLPVRPQNLAPGRGPRSPT